MKRRWSAPSLLRVVVRALLACIVGMPLLAPAANATVADVVISQVYGGGGTTFTHDYIELHNRGNSPVDLTNWTVQYASATGTTWTTTLLKNSIPAGGYYLVQEGTAGSGSALPTPDATGTLTLNAVTGKVLLVNGPGQLSGDCPSSGSIVDKVAYGPTATCYEGTGPAPAISTILATFRGNKGCTDTNDNAADFTSDTPAPRNSASPIYKCEVSLTVLASPAEGGSVSKSPDNPTYVAGTSVNLTPTANTGYEFTGWSGDGSGSTVPLSVLMDGDKTVTANFSLQAHTLNITIVGSGTVAKDPDQSSYDHGSHVQLTPTADPNYHFVGWSVDASGSTVPLDVTMDADKNITATFALDTHTLSVLIDGHGSVSKSPDHSSYDYGSSVDLTPVPVPGYHFDHWSGDASGNTIPAQVTLNADATVTAHFVANDHAGDLVISQVFGAGGDNPTGPKNDFVELFNRGTAPLSLAGWSLQFTGPTGSDWSSVGLAGLILPAHYYLVQLHAGGSGSVTLPAPEAIGTLDLGATAGKVALVNGTTALTGSCPTSTDIVDFVGYGAADCSQVDPAGATSATAAAFRGNRGCVQTFDNQADFAGGSPLPKNGLGSVHLCSNQVAVEQTPTTLFLSASRPNPSAGGIRCSVAMPTEGDVRLSISDVQGRRIALLVDGSMSVGRHEISWSGVTNSGPVKSGLYYLTLEAMGQRIVRSFVLMR